MICNVVNREICDDAIFYAIIKHIVSLMPNLTNMVVQYQYSNYAMTIRNRYEALNRYLMSVLGRSGGVRTNGELF